MKQLSNLFPISAEARIIQFMIMESAGEPEKVFNTTEITKGTKLALRTVHTRLPKLIKYGIIIKSDVKRVGKTKKFYPYQYNYASELARSLVVLQVRLTNVEAD